MSSWPWPPSRSVLLHDHGPEDRRSLPMVVMVLTDANLATGVSPFPRPKLDPSWVRHLRISPPFPRALGPTTGIPNTGMSKRFIPGSPGGMHTLTGLAHDEGSKVAYTSDINQRASTMRSRKMAVFQSTLQPPKVNGPDEGDLLWWDGGAPRGPSRKPWRGPRRRGSGFEPPPDLPLAPGAGAEGDLQQVQEGLHRGDQLLR